MCVCVCADPSICGSLAGPSGSGSSEVCTVYEQYFWRESDRTHHKCIIVRQQPVDQQPDESSARGVDDGLGIKENLLCIKAGPSQFEPITEQPVICSDCNKSFRQPGTTNQHSIDTFCICCFFNNSHSLESEHKCSVKVLSFSTDVETHLQHW